MRYLFLALPLAIFLLIGVVAFVMLDANLSGERNSRSIGFSMTGSDLPDLAMQRYDGSGIISLDALKGEVFAVNVFASWCAPCQLEAPALEKLAEEIPIIGINYRDTPEDAKTFLTRFGNPYKTIGLDPDGAVSIQLGVHGLPETFIIGKDHVIVYHHQGPIFASDLSGAIANAIKDGS